MGMQSLVVSACSCPAAGSASTASTARTPLQNTQHKHAAMQALHICKGQAVQQGRTCSTVSPTLVATQHYNLVPGLQYILVTGGQHGVTLPHWGTCSTHIIQAQNETLGR